MGEGVSSVGRHPEAMIALCRCSNTPLPKGGSSKKLSRAGIGVFAEQALLFAQRGPELGCRPLYHHYNLHPSPLLLRLQLPSSTVGQGNDLLLGHLFSSLLLFIGVCWQGTKGFLAYQALFVFLWPHWDEGLCIQTRNCVGTMCSLVPLYGALECNKLLRQLILTNLLRQQAAQRAT